MPTFFLAMILAFPGDGDRSFELDPPCRHDLVLRIEATCGGRPGGVIRDALIRAALPATDERQTITALRCDPEPLSVLTDEFGNRFAEWRRSQLRGDEIWRIEISLTAEVRAIIHAPESRSLLSLDQVPEPIAAQYLGSGPKYSRSDPKIVAAARQLRHEATSPLDLAFRANEFVRTHLTYERDGRWDDAAIVLEQGHGSCSEYNFLFLALCREAGLPARWVGATACRSSQLPYEDEVFHRWSEVYLPGHGWFPVDVSRNDGEDGAPINQAFGRISDRLLITMKGDGSETHPLRHAYIAHWESKPSRGATLDIQDKWIWAPFKTANSPANPGR